MKKTSLISVASAALLSACGNNAVAPVADAETAPLAPAEWADAAARFVARDGAESGHAILTDAPAGGVLMRLSVTGLTPGWHGVHLHQIGDCSDGANGFQASGGHVDPESREHGFLNPGGPERADLPNIYANSDGRAVAEIFNASIALLPSEASAASVGPYPLFDEDGFAIVVHENSDDHKAQPIGGAGGRVACAAFVER